jgi:serine/threonine-protein kinase RsbW
MATNAPAVERVEMVIANRVEDFARVAARLDDLGARRGVPGDAVADMNVALDEVLMNVVSHAYGDAAAHEIRIALAVFPGALKAEVEDDGRPFDPLTVPPPNRSAPFAARKVGGLGIHFVRSLMSEFAYQRIDHRNRLVLTRTFARELGQGRADGA